MSLKSKLSQFSYVPELAYVLYEFKWDVWAW